MNRLPGGPVRSSRRTIWTPRWEVTFEPEVTEAEIDAFMATFWAHISRPVAGEPIPDFAECGRPGCDLREKRLEHGHFGDRPSPYLIGLRSRRFDGLDRRAAVVIITAAAVIAGLTMLLREVLS